MRSRRSSPQQLNARRSIGVVIAALIALVAQLMTPGASLAAQAAMAANPAICADMPGMAGMDMAGMDHDAKAPAADKGGKGFGGLPCQDCLVPATAALPPSLATPIPISYATAYIRRVTFVQYRVPPARAPPRPPGQGPPTSDV